MLVSKRDRGVRSLVATNRLKVEVSTKGVSRSDHPNHSLLVSPFCMSESDDDCSTFTELDRFSLSPASARIDEMCSFLGKAQLVSFHDGSTRRDFSFLESPFFDDILFQT